jgi:site-specific recombinase XerD
MLPQCSHITRKRGIYYYRRRLPGATKSELALSLRTRMFPEAQWLSQRLDGAFERVLQRMAEQNKDRADIGEIAKQYLRGCLDYDLSQRQAWAAQPPKTDRDKWFASIHFVAEELGSAKDDLVGRGRPDRHAQLIDMLMDEHKVPEDRRGELTLAILRAHVAKWETIRKRTLGDFSDLDTQPVPSNSATVAPAPTGPLLSEALPGFLDLMSKQGEWRGQTLAQNTTTYEMFTECCGDKPVATYDRKDLAAFYDLLRALPRLYSKSAEWKGLSLTEVAELTKTQDHERLSMTTVKRHFSALGRLFTHLKRRGEYSGDNPAHGFEFPDKRRTRDKRSMWDGESLAKLFSSPVWAGCFSERRRSKPGKLIIKDEKYWLPLLALYHGNRLEEFAQLHRSDVRLEGDIWTLDINDEGHKQVKNAQSKRRVPLHPELQRLGFLDYVAATAPNPDDRVFPQLQPGGSDRKFGHSFTKWWSRYRREVGLYKQGMDYHAFRAGIATQLAGLGVPLEVRNELLGHEGKSVDERNYQKGFPLKLLAEAIARVSWPEVHLS